MRLLNLRKTALLSLFFLVTGAFAIINPWGKSNNHETVARFLSHWSLILGNGENISDIRAFKDSRYFYEIIDEGKAWLVFKTPNGGETHGTSNNTRTELAQTQKWDVEGYSELAATVKIMAVSETGRDDVPASHSTVIGQIHSADGFENEPLKIFYKKYPGHKKGSVFWHYEINTAGDNNAKRWDFSTAVWGYDFSTVGPSADTAPDEPKDGIELGESFSYSIVVVNGEMKLVFQADNHPTKTFIKSIVKSDYVEEKNIHAQTKKLFFPLGQNGLERSEAYRNEGLFFKIGAYNQTNGKSYSTNPNWCSDAETHHGNLLKQYNTGNYTEVWFTDLTLKIPENSISNGNYFRRNDHY
tara:strand:- start:6331 stop:7398 length:1068 start_codon:yes stop_codon:yes gene_type:complete